MGEVLKFPEPENPDNMVIDHLTDAYYNNENIVLMISVENLLTGISWDAPVPPKIRAKIIKLVLDDFKRFLSEDDNGL